MGSEHTFEREAVPKRNKAGGLDGSAYEQLVQSVVDYAIFMLDPEGHVSSWNPGAERIKPGFPRWIGFWLTLWRCLSRTFKGLRSKRRLGLLSPAAPAVIGLYPLA